MIKQGPNFHKTTFFIDLHQTQASQRFLASLARSRSQVGLKTLILIRLPKRVETNAIDHQILIPTIVHRSKSELELPRYCENWYGALIDAPQTSESNNF